MHPSLFVSRHTQGNLGFSDRNTANPIFEGNRILCRESDIRPGVGKKSYDGRWWEWQANRAIGGLLLPVDLVKETVSPFLQESLVTKRPSLPEALRQKAEQEVAKVFDVNPVVARIRIQEIFPTQDASQFEF